MTEQELKAAMKNPKGGFFFFGEEEYLVSFYANVLKKAVCPDDAFAAEFNSITIDGEEILTSGMGSLLDAIMAPPMMADMKIVELKDPDLIAVAAKEELADAFYEVLQSLKKYDHTVLLIRTAPEHFDAGYLPKRPSNMYKKISSLMNTVNFELPAPARLRTWIKKHFTGDGIEISPEMCDEVISMCGRSMRVLSFEIDKLTAYILANEKNELTHDILMNVSCAALGEDAFELANAILDGSRERAFASLQRHKLAKEEPIVVLGGISKVWCDLLSIKAEAELGLGEAEIAAKLKLNEYRVRLYLRAAAKISRDRLEKAVRMCSEADIKLKSTTLGYIAVERLLCACL